MTPAPLHLFLLSGVLPVGPVESVRVVHQDSAAQDVVAERREEIHEIPVVQHPFDVGVWEVGAPQHALWAASISSRANGTRKALKDFVWTVFNLQ